MLVAVYYIADDWLVFWLRNVWMTKILMCYNLTAAIWATSALLFPASCTERGSLATKKWVHGKKKLNRGQQERKLLKGLPDLEQHSPLLHIKLLITHLKWKNIFKEHVLPHRQVAFFSCQMIFFIVFFLFHTCTHWSRWYCKEWHGMVQHADDMKCQIMEAWSCNSLISLLI